MATGSAVEYLCLSAKAGLVGGSARAIWHRSAPGAVRKAYGAGNAAAGWAAWKKHLATRKRPADPEQLLPSTAGSLSWALPENLHAPATPAWLRAAQRGAASGDGQDRSLESDLPAWATECCGAAAGPGGALEALACCRALPRLASTLPEKSWWTLLDHLLVTAEDAQALRLESEPLLHQLLAGELPLTLAYLLPELTPCRKRKASARRALSSGAIELLDGEGLPHGRYLTLLRPLLACWTRCRAMGDRLKGGCWTAAANTQYEWLVRQALRLTRHDGAHVFSDGAVALRSSELLRAALRLGGNHRDRRIAALVLPGKRKAGKTRADESGLPKPVTHSEWAATAVLRSQWSRGGERLTVVYPDRSVRVELACGSDVLFSGEWELQVRVDGEPLRPDSDWEELCWFSDKEVDFLELEISLGGGFRVQRQVLWARKDAFLLLADVILGPRRAELQYGGSLPLCRGVRFRAARDTREGLLVGSRRRASVLPLALPEWRADRRVGELGQTPAGLELRQSVTGQRAYAPLFFDLERRRLDRPLTWRQLTVGESLRAQPPEVAVGYRVAVGGRQWLFYRSLAEKGNRTLLGHNLSTEMLAARFLRRGEVEPLLEIE